jgi:histidine triad (HIT) family protein
MLVSQGLGPPAGGNNASWDASLSPLYYLWHYVNLGGYMHKCIFCGIVKGEEGSWRIYEDREVIAFLDKYPISYGHVLVAPRDHYEDVVKTPPHLASRSFIVARALGRASIKHLGATGFRIVTNTGSSAGQIIFHFHVHVIPRYGFGDPGSIEPRTEIRDEIAREIVKIYKEALKDPEIIDMINGSK